MFAVAFLRATRLAHFHQFITLTYEMKSTDFTAPCKVIYIQPFVTLRTALSLSLVLYS
jgi:hypothetical protein